MNGCDSRNIRTGSEIPTETYSDQPYVVRTADGAWLCILTTGSGEEGSRGQHVITTRSTDRGQTWSAPVALEPPTGPEASYAVLLRAPNGRVFAFYNHNTDNLRAVRADNPPFKDGLCRRVDSQGYFVFRYSDDHGRTWSPDRYTIPMRRMAIDRRNAYGGEILFFWNVGRPFIREGTAYVPLHKVGGFGHGFFTSSEGVLLASPDLLGSADPGSATWETLPDGDAGLRTPAGGGPIAEEHSFSLLSDGSLYCVYRTIDGYPAESYSRDGGHTWSPPRYKCYADGSRMKHPRAANFAWRRSDGTFLYWFHNHGGTWYDDRNPVWLCAGRETESPEGRVIEWTRPEVVLYDDDPFIRISYPDLVEEDDGSLYLTETQKDKARVHRIDPGLIDRMLTQFDVCESAREGLLLEVRDPRGSVDAPALPLFCVRDSARPDYGTDYRRGGFSIELAGVLRAAEPGAVLLDGRDETGRGAALLTAPAGAFELVLNDGRTENRWRSDTPRGDGDGVFHVVATVDAGPRIITFVVDGVPSDGGTARQFGWGRFSPDLREANGAKQWRTASAEIAALSLLRIYGRALLTTEAIGNRRAATGAPA